MNRRGFFRKAVGAVAAGAVAGHAEAAAKPKPWHVPMESCAGVASSLTPYQVRAELLDLKPINFEDLLTPDTMGPVSHGTMTFSGVWDDPVDVEYEVIVRPARRDRAGD